MNIYLAFASFCGISAHHSIASLTPPYIVQIKSISVIAATNNDLSKCYFSAG